MFNEEELKSILLERLKSYEGLPNTKAVRDSIVSEIVEIFKKIGLEEFDENFNLDNVLNALKLGRWGRYGEETD